MTSPPLTCAGRALDRDGQPVGDPCGQTFTPRPVPAPEANPVPGGWTVGSRPASDVERDGQARAAGWSVGVLADGRRAATCPACRKPDPDLVTLCRDLQEGLPL